jgi:ribosomal protein S18 acetylase RimI-like enzyme
MKYIFYHNINDIPKNILTQFDKKIFHTNNSILLFIDDLLSGLNTKTYVILVVMDNEKLVGTLGIAYLSSKIKKLMNLEFLERTYDVRNIYILPEYRGKKICSKMINKLKKYVYPKVKRLNLWVDSTNIAAIKCYKSSGFIEYKNKKAIKWLNDNIEKYFGFINENKLVYYTIKL